MKFIDCVKLKLMPVKCQTDIAINRFHIVFYIDNLEQLSVNISANEI